jgi:Domain of unknown function (DUF6457)
MTTIEKWAEAVCADLGVRAGDGAIRVVLDLARDVAHQVERPAAPVSAFLLGLAVGAGQPLDATAGRIVALAASWPSSAAQ